MGLLELLGPGLRFEVTGGGLPMHASFDGGVADDIGSLIGCHYLRYCCSVSPNPPLSTKSARVFASLTVQAALARWREAWRCVVRGRSTASITPRRKAWSTTS